MPELHTLLTGLAFGESPRWHDGRLWVADWGAREILAVDREGQREVIVKVTFPAASSLLGRSRCSRLMGQLARWPMASPSPTAWL